MMNATRFDRAVWDSLTTLHAPFAERVGKAVRFQDDIGPFTSTEDDTPEALEDLKKLLPVGQTHFLMQTGDPKVPGEIQILDVRDGVQFEMIEPRFLEIEPDPTFEKIGDAESSEMVALADLTKPGPFRSRTHKLGQFYGVKQEGRLIAMAGERLKHDGISEISGVCVHPDFQGQGLGKKLTAFIAQNIWTRGEVPYLHAWADNAPAIKLYEAMGFRVRCIVKVAFIERV